MIIENKNQTKQETSRWWNPWKTKNKWWKFLNQVTQNKVTLEIC